MFDLPHWQREMDAINVAGIFTVRGPSVDSDFFLVRIGKQPNSVVSASLSVESGRIRQMRSVMTTKMKKMVSLVHQPAFATKKKYYRNYKIAHCLLYYYYFNNKKARH